MSDYGTLSWWGFGLMLGVCIAAVRVAYYRGVRVGRESCDCANMDALEVLCRVFDDGVDVAYPEWLAWYKPEQWLRSERALGGFIWQRLKPERDELQALRNAKVALAGEPTVLQASLLPDSDRA